MSSFFIYLHSTFFKHLIFFFCRYMNTLKNADGSLNDEGKMLIGEDMSGSEDSEESDSEDERVDADFIKKMIAKNGGGDAAASDSDSEEEEEESEDEEEEPAPKKVKAVVTPSGKKSKQNTPASKAKQTPNSNQKNNKKSGEKRKR